MTIWTKQHKNILAVLENEGRYIVKREYIEQKLDSIAGFYFDVYSWYVKKASSIVEKPADVKYPIWVSLDNESTLANDQDTVLLELSVPDESVIEVCMDKWGYVVNYFYLPIDDSDAEEHKRLLGRYNIDDVGAYMSDFYPAIKSKIIKSWDRLFDGSVGNTSFVRTGTIWEIRDCQVLKVI